MVVAKNTYQKNQNVSGWFKFQERGNQVPIIGWYYLHTNGDLIYKRELGSTAADIRESVFAVGMWPVDPEDRKGAWSILVEASSVGANKAHITNLAKKWGCCDGDAINYAKRVGCTLNLDGDDKVAKTRNGELKGVGPTYLDAMSNLCKALGYSAGKIWNNSFERLLSDIPR